MQAGARPEAQVGADENAFRCRDRREAGAGGTEKPPGVRERFDL